MKVLFPMITLALVLASCSSRDAGKGAETGSGTAAENVSPAENIKTVRLDVKGMTCEGCENAIVSSISNLDGIQEATASHTGEEAVVRFDSTRTSVEDISRAISDAGYSVEGEKL